MPTSMFDVVPTGSMIIVNAWYAADDLVLLALKTK